MNKRKLKGWVVITLFVITVLSIFFIGALNEKARTNEIETVKTV